nr:hypothetical protein [Tanacetum cinerariifolium]
MQEGFDHIVDFLTAHSIQYALMVNPTIYVSCIKQFWASVLIKKSNDAVKLQAGKDYAKTIKNQSKPGNIGHEIESLHQKPNQKAFFYKDQANKAKCQKIKSSRAILANSPKSISKEKGKSKSRVIFSISAKLNSKDQSCQSLKLLL